MLMKNKKGFTIVELLGVIVILTIITLIAIPSTSHLLKKSNESYINFTYENIKSAATEYVMDKNYSLDPEYTYEIRLKDLIDESYIDPIKNPETKKNCNFQSSYVNVTNKAKADDTHKKLSYSICLVCGSFNGDDDKRLNTCHDASDWIGFAYSGDKDSVINVSNEGFVVNTNTKVPLIITSFNDLENEDYAKYTIDGPNIITLGSDSNGHYFKSGNIEGKTKIKVIYQRGTDIGYSGSVDVTVRNDKYTTLTNVSEYKDYSLAVGNTYDSVFNYGNNGGLATSVTNLECTTDNDSISVSTINGGPGVTYCRVYTKHLSKNKATVTIKPLITEHFPNNNIETYTVVPTPRKNSKYSFVYEGERIVTSGEEGVYRAVGITPDDFSGVVDVTFSTKESSWPSCLESNGDSYIFHSNVCSSAKGTYVATINYFGQKYTFTKEVNFTRKG